MSAQVKYLTLRPENFESEVINIGLWTKRKLVSERCSLTIPLKLFLCDALELIC